MIEYIFIIPYRNREQQKHFFMKYMNYLLEDYEPSSYEIIFVHQKNDLPFNRGGMKNIGFLYAKSKYTYYKNITFIFNDVDTLPYKKNLLKYKTEAGKVKHFYGYNYALGGIFSIIGDDFEKINGFPNLWGWGIEDNIIQDRVNASKLKTDRNNFYKIGDQSIIHLYDGAYKYITYKAADNYLDKKIVDGLSSIKNLNYSFNYDTNMLDVTHFTSQYNPKDELFKKFNVMNSKKIKRDIKPTKLGMFDFKKGRK